MNDEADFVIAAFMGDLAKVEEYLALVCNIETIYNGFTPLMAAAQEGHIDVCRLLIERGADINVLTSVGETPLRLAAGKGHASIVKLLCENHANVNMRGADAATAVYLACQNSDILVVETLLGYGADVNLADEKYGKTPLMQAVENGAIELVQLLLNSGADIHATSYKGMNAIFLADFANHQEIKELLAAAGAHYTGCLTSSFLLKYMEFLKQNHPEEYDDEITQYISGGICGGYSRLCIILATFGLVKRFHSELNRISFWNGEHVVLENNHELRLLMNNIKIICNMQKLSGVAFVRQDYPAPEYYVPDTNISFRTLMMPGFLFEKVELLKCLSVIFNNTRIVTMANMLCKHMIAVQCIGDNEFVLYNSAFLAGPMLINGIENLCRFILYAFDKIPITSRYVGLYFEFIGNDNTLSSDNKVAIEEYFSSLVAKRAEMNTINNIDENGDSALCYAMGSRNLLLELIKNNARVDVIKRSARVGILALQSGRLHDTSDELVCAGMDLNLTNDDIHTILRDAVYMNNMTMVKTLASLGVSLQPELYNLAKDEGHDALAEYINEQLQITQDNEMSLFCRP